VVLRAGAVGVHGGIEEAIDALAHLPEDVVFLIMGRPSEAYRRGLAARIAARGLTRRVILWDRPSDEDWKRALQGADVGHLIHGPFPEGPMRNVYALNSSLSNNRLFQYMAAGLPIVAYDDPRLAAIMDEVPCFRAARLEHLESDFIDILGSLAREPELREKLGRGGRSAHLTTYSWERQFAKILLKSKDLVSRKK
jgi:glycosyltransferase involved in cell wall biosynthesis